MSYPCTALIGFTLALSACTPSPPMSGPMLPVAVDCHDEAAQSMVGSVATPVNVEQARTRADAQTARVLKPRQVVTQEYRYGRLNIDVDANDVILGVRCG